MLAASNVIYSLQFSLVSKAKELALVTTFSMFSLQAPDPLMVAWFCIEKWAEKVRPEDYL